MSQSAGNFDLNKYEPKPGGREGRGDRGARAREPLGKLFDKMPPQSPEAEMSLLGSMILDPSVIGDVIGLVGKAEDFYLEKHGHIFRALVDVYDRHHSGDLVQINELLRDRGVLEGIGGADYLATLANAVPSAVNAPFYAKIVAEKAKLRRLIDAAGQILYDAYHAGDLGPEGAKETLDRAEMMVFEIAQEQDKSDPQLLKDLLQIEIDRIEANEGKGYSGLPTGFSDLDEMLRGLQQGELLILAARPSMGKTALALNLAEQIAIGGGYDAEGRPRQSAPVAVFSLEMSKGAVTQRLLSARSGISSQHLRSGQRVDFKKLLEACSELEQAPIFIDDTPNMSILTLRARARRLVAQHGVKCIMIDYLQLMSAPTQAKDGRQNEVSAISRGVKALARELSVPIVCLSQLNRASEQREGNRPRMADLRESGSIEQDADVILLLHREEYYHTQNPTWADENPDRVGIAEIIIAKQRNGPTGVVELKWDSSTTKFKNLSKYGGFGDDAGSYAAPSQAAQSFAAPPRPAPRPAAPAADPNEAPPFDDAPTPPPAPRGFAPGKKQGPLGADDPRWRDGGGSRAEDDDLGDLPV